MINYDGVFDDIATFYLFTSGYQYIFILIKPTKSRLLIIKQTINNELLIIYRFGCEIVAMWQ